ncbi:thiamine pyridinylase [Clostridium sp. W14A]|nr:thiamine pyridinylase [Clostridium sp. W14A]
MKKRHFRVLTKKIFSIMLLFIVVFSSSSTIASAQNVSHNEAMSTSLNIAIYDYVPNPSNFKKAIRSEWSKIEPNVSLNFVDWNCYKKDPPNNVDVFVFDSTYLTHFIRDGYLTPFQKNEIENSSDIIDFAISGCTENNKIYAIPQILCTNFLYYRKSDVAIDQAHNVNQLYQVIGNNTSSSIIPPPNKGLLIVT